MCSVVVSFKFDTYGKNSVREEFNLNPELYNDIEIEKKAFDIYWQEKVKQTFNTIKFYGYISTNNKEA